MRAKRPYMLSPGTGGVDRFDTAGKSLKLWEGYDVIAGEGELRRRDGFFGITASPGFPFPGPRTTLLVSAADASGATASAVTNRLLVPNNGPYFFIGLNEVFDGIDVPLTPTTTLGNTTPAASLRLQGHYWNGSAWTAMPWVFDSTRGRATGTSASFAPFYKAGQVSWHRSQFSGWTTSTLGGVTAYWVRLTTVNAAGTATACSHTGAVGAPGVRGLLRGPVNLLAPVNLGGRHCLVIGGDRFKRRGLEGGANLADWRYNREAPYPMALTKYKSAGVFGSVTYPQWGRRVDTDPAGVFTAVGSTGSEGAANVLTDHPQINRAVNDPYPEHSYLEDNPVDGVVVQNIVAQAGSTTTSFVTQTITGRANMDYEGYILVVTTAGNLTLGDYRIVSSFTGGAVDSTFVTRAWSAAPNTSVRWRLIRPPKRFRIYADRTGTGMNQWLNRVIGIPPVPSATLPTVGAAAVPINSADPDDYQHGGYIASAGICHHQMVDDLRWAVSSGRRWSYVYDTVTRALLMTNGESGILEYDGEILRELKADISSDLAQYLAGKIADEREVQTGSDPSLLARSKFRSRPPNGKYLATFRNVLVVGGSSTSPYTIWNSYSGGANNIWPLVAETQIRDQEVLTGLAALYDRIFAFTKNSIHEGFIQDNGSLAFNPISQGVGFTAHHAVVQVPYNNSLVLAGPSPSGIFITNGSEPTAVLDSWDRLVPGGINTLVLDRAVGVVLQSQTLAIWFVASRGSTVNDLGLVWDYSTNAWYLWRHSIGVESAATAMISGRETLLLGTADGVVQMLRDCPDDDGSTITGDVLSAPEQPAGPSELSFSRFNFTAAALGSGETMSVAAYVNHSDVSTQGAVVAMPVTRGANVFGGTPVWSPAGLGNTDAVWADEPMKSFSVNLPRGTRGTIVQYRVRGSARWRLRQVSVEGEQKSSRGQR